MSEISNHRHKAPLDAVRALAALVVFASHLIQIFWLPVYGLGTIVHRVNSYTSECAVIIFFVLSGYLISLSIRSNVARNGYFDVWEYAKSRFLRIYPPLFCAVVISFLVFVIVKAGSFPGSVSPLRLSSDLYAARDLLLLQPEEWFTALTMRAGLLVINGPLWSLYIELKLYVVAAAVAFMFAGPLLAPIRVVVGGFVALLVMKWGIDLNPEFLLYASWWGLGVIFLLSEPKRRCRYLLASLSLVLLAAITALSDARLYDELVRFVIVWKIAELMFLHWTFENELLSEIAGYSYTLYLVHFPLLLLVYSLFMSFAQAEYRFPFDRGMASALGIVLVLVTSRSIGRYAENPRRVLMLFQKPARASQRDLL